MTDDALDIAQAFGEELLERAELDAVIDVDAAADPDDVDRTAPREVEQ